MAKTVTPNKSEAQLLRQAAAAGNCDEIKSLVKLPTIDINAENNYGQRALHNAATNGHTEAVILLLKEGAAIDAKTRAGDTALLAAARNGHTQVVDVLLKENANPNAFNTDGWTAAHFAVANNHEAVVGLLLKYAADLTLMSKDHKTPADLATEMTAPGLRRLLKLGEVAEVKSPTGARRALSPPPPERSSPAENRDAVRRVLHFDAPAPVPSPQQSAIAGLLAGQYAMPVAPMPQQPLGDVRSVVVERLIELVEAQAREIASLQSQMKALSARVDSLAHSGFPHVLELRLDGRPAVYQLTAKHAPPPLPSGAPSVNSPAVASKPVATTSSSNLPAAAAAATTAPAPASPQQDKAT